MNPHKEADYDPTRVDRVRSRIALEKQYDYRIGAVAKDIIENGVNNLSDSELSLYMKDSPFKDDVNKRIKQMKEDKSNLEADLKIIKNERSKIEVYINESEDKIVNDHIDAILVVDDIKKDLERIIEILTPLNIKIYTASNYTDALEILKNNSISLLITDIVFPMYKMTKKEYKTWEFVSTTKHEYLRMGQNTEPIEVTKTYLEPEETNDIVTFAGFNLLDDAKKLLPWLPVIIITRYDDVEIIRRAIGTKFKDILIKDKHLKNPDLVITTVKSFMTPTNDRLSVMSHVDLKNYLNSLDEKTLTLKVLIPLFIKLGYQDVKYTHGTMENGIDIIFSETDRLRKKKYVGVQVKINEIHKQVGKPEKNIDGLIDQVKFAFASDIYLLPNKTEVRLSQFIIITSKKFTNDAIIFIQKSLNERVNPQLIEFWDGDEIIKYIKNSKL